VSDHTFLVYWSVLVPTFIFLLFLPMELIAVFTHRSKTDTLSAWVWRLIGTRDGWHWYNAPGRIGVLVLFLWLAEHFTFGWV
jgi:hypothetical protein